MLKRSIGDIAAACNGRACNCGLADNVGKIVINDKTVEKDCLFVALKGESFDGNSFISSALEKGAKAVLTDKTQTENVPYILVDDARKALIDMAHFFRLKERKNVVCVTGSVGKTTVKELIASILSTNKTVLKTDGNKNNTVGLPLTLLSDDGTETAVLEMGISEVGEMDALSYASVPDVAVITNIGSMHAESLGTRENIAREKMKCVSCASEGAVTFVPYGEPLLNGIQNKMTVGIDEARADVYAKNVIFYEDGSSFDVVFLKSNGESCEIKNVFVPITGKHGVIDALFACAVARELGASDESITLGIGGYKNDPLRQNIFSKNGVKVMVDCYNSGPESLCASLEAFARISRSADPRKTVLLLGSMLELGDISASEHIKIGEMIAEMGFTHIVTVGEEAKCFALGALMGNAKVKTVSFSEDEREAVMEYLSKTDFCGGAVLIKGSRKMKMEEFLPYTVKED